MEINKLTEKDAIHCETIDEVLRIKSLSPKFAWITKTFSKRYIADGLVLYAAGTWGSVRAAKSHNHNIIPSTAITSPTNAMEEVKTFKINLALENLEQSLLENMADWLNSEYVKNYFSDAEFLDNEDLHIDMKNAAFGVLKNSSSKYFHCNECTGTTQSTVCENPSCPDMPCCGKSKDECSCFDKGCPFDEAAFTPKEQQTLSVDEGKIHKSSCNMPDGICKSFCLNVCAIQIFNPEKISGEIKTKIITVDDFEYEISLQKPNIGVELVIGVNSQSYHIANKDCEFNSCGAILSSNNEKLCETYGVPTLNSEISVRELSERPNMEEELTFSFDAPKEEAVSVEEGEIQNLSPDEISERDLCFYQFSNSPSRKLLSDYFNEGWAEKGRYMDELKELSKTSESVKMLDEAMELLKEAENEFIFHNWQNSRTVRQLAEFLSKYEQLKQNK